MKGEYIPYEVNPELVQVFIGGGRFGFGISRMTPNGRLSTGAMWDLDNAERPLPPNLARALERY